MQRSCASILSLRSCAQACSESWTAEDWTKAGLGKLVCVHPMPFTDGRPMREVLRPVLASGEVHHVGDVVAAVVAENALSGQLDALEAIDVEYEPLPAAGQDRPPRSITMLPSFTNNSVPTRSTRSYAATKTATASCLCKGGAQPSE